MLRVVGLPMVVLASAFICLAQPGTECKLLSIGDCTKDEMAPSCGGNFGLIPRPGARRQPSYPSPLGLSFFQGKPSDERLFASSFALDSPLSSHEGRNERFVLPLKPDADQRYPIPPFSSQLPCLARGHTLLKSFHLFGSELCVNTAAASFTIWPGNIGEDDTAAQSSASARPSNPKPGRPHLIELNSSNWRPLTDSQKFALFWKDLLHWETHASLAFDSGISFALGGRSYLGSGGEQYLAIYGLDVADEENFTFFNAFFLPWIFHEDPRYIPLGHGSTGERLTYAISRVFVTRNDAGHSEFNKSRVLGTVIATSLSSAYYSIYGANVSVGGNFASIGINLASEAAFDVFKELWPEAARKLKINLWIRTVVTNAIRDQIRVQ
jgi:hypothetical protein